MKKIRFVLMVLTVISTLVACNTVTYVTEAADFAGDMTMLANDLPILLPQAVAKEEKRRELEEKLIEAKSDIEEFNSLTPPSNVEEMHKRVVELNTLSLSVIDLYLNAIENGKLDQTFIEKYPLLDSLNKITEMVNRLKNA